jgi:hypothetical protein
LTPAIPGAAMCSGMPVARASRASISSVGKLPPPSIRAIEDWVVPMRRIALEALAEQNGK